MPAMRLPIRPLLAVALLPVPALASEGGEKVNLLSPNGGLMFWTLLIFVVLLLVLKRFAFGPMLAAVEAREASLAAAIEQARTDREAAAQLLREQQAALDAARADAQRLIAEGRAAAEKLKASLLDEARAQQQEIVERARRELEGEKARAIGELRREAVDLALAGAGKLIAKNLDDAGNRALVEQFLSSIPAAGSR